MYKCKFCEKEFEKQQGWASHECKCKLNPDRNKYIYHLNYARSCKRDFKEKDETEYNCQYCGKICVGKNSLVQHEIRCKNNPNRITNTENFVSNFTKYNEDCRNGIRHHPHKGQTKETCESIKKGVETRKKKIEEGKMHGSFYMHRHSEETKEKMRKARLDYMKNHPENTAWRKRNEPSYPEKCFIKFLEENEYDKKYLIEREKSVFPYYIDFAFIQPKLAIEIDGSQHINDEERKERDKKKNTTLMLNGWKVLRITENLVKTDWKTIKENIDKLICDNCISTKKCGIFLSKKRQKVERGKDGLSNKMREASIKQRKVKNRPTLEKLMEMKKTMSNEAIGKLYNVTEACIRKWIKNY